MGFLEDIGRSGAMNSVNNVMERAIQLRQQEDQGAERAFNTSLNMEKLGMEKAAADREATKFRWAEKEQKAKEDILDMPVPISKFLGTDYAADPAKKMMFDMAKQKGMVNEVAPGVLMTTTRNAQAFKQYMTDDLEFTKKLNETNMVKINNQIAELGTALLEESNPKKIEEMTATKAKLEQQLGVLAKAHKDIDFAHQNKLEEIAAAREGKAADVVQAVGPDGKPVFIPKAEAVGKTPYVKDANSQYQEEYVIPMLENWKQANPNATPRETNDARARIYIEGQERLARAQQTAAPGTQILGPATDEQGNIVPGEYKAYDPKNQKMFTLKDPGKGGFLGEKGTKRLPTAAIDTLSGLRTTEGNIQDIRDSWNTALTGPFKGRVNEALQKVKDAPEFEELRRRVNRMITVAYDLSGKQVSEREIITLKKNILPGIEQMDKNFLKSVDELDRWIKRVKSNKEAEYKRQGFNVGEFPTLAASGGNVVPRKPGESVADYLKRTGK